MDVLAPIVLPGEDGEKIVPSIVSLTPEGAVIVGNPARQELINHPDRSIYSVTPDGSRFQDVADELKLFPFRRRRQRIRHTDRARRKDLHPARNLRLYSEAAQTQRRSCARWAGLGAVITVPAYFNDAQRQATRDAGRIAGLEVLRLVNEPTAAAPAYGLDKRKEGTIAVYDLGGGTFDISILKLHEGIFEVLATAGDTHLGGDDIDNRLHKNALEDRATEWQQDVSHSGEAVQTLRQSVIRAKEALSYEQAVPIEFAWDGKHYRREITRELFENLIRDIVDRTLGPCRQCMKDAGAIPPTSTKSLWLAGPRVFRWFAALSKSSFVRVRIPKSIPTKWSPSVPPFKPVSSRARSKTRFCSM